MSRMIGSGIRTYKISYDSGGRRKTLKIPLANGVSYLNTEYGYDNADRVLSMLHTAGVATIENLTYGYDANGNRTRFSRNAAQALSPSISGTAYDEANEMLAYNGKTLRYDANGNLETKTDAAGTTTYSWDARNRLVGIDGPSLLASFRYDATNRRISKTVNGATTQYLYDGWDVIQEVKAGGKVNYIRLPTIDEPLTRIDGATMRHYVRDALSTVLGLADEGGAMKTTYTYDAYGRSTATGEPSANPFQFTGRENDGTGLFYYRYRYYSPEMQRFISEDPIGLRGGINYFVYVQNNPINWTDSFGFSRDKFVPDKYRHGDPHVDRYNPEGQNVGRYRPDGSPIEHKGKCPDPISKKDMPKFLEAVKKLGLGSSDTFAPFLILPGQPQILDNINSGMPLNHYPGEVY